MNKKIQLALLIEEQASQHAVNLLRLNPLPEERFSDDLGIELSQTPLNMDKFQTFKKRFEDTLRNEQGDMLTLDAANGDLDGYAERLLKLLNNRFTKEAAISTAYLLCLNERQVILLDFNRKEEAEYWKRVEKFFKAGIKRNIHSQECDLFAKICNDMRLMGDEYFAFRDRFFCEKAIESEHTSA